MKPDSSFYRIQSNEHFIINQIRQEEYRGNKDNISRTKAYQRYFLKNPEIPWAFLASMVSRNTGWNMGDLYGEVIPDLLDEKIRKRLFLTLEKANWIIFKDAFPQLLLYQYSKKAGRPMFHLLKYFNVSSFIQYEWQLFWETGDRKRLLYALIVNEQHVIQKPVILHPSYKYKIFHSAFFIFHELFHFNCIIFPTINGELYGESVVQFTKVWKRIGLGKRLSTILFDPDLYPRFLHFAINTEPTGSRHDYEQYGYERRRRKTPFIRAVVPIIEHQRRQVEDWSIHHHPKPGWEKAPLPSPSVALTSWFYQKNEQIELYHLAKRLLSKR
ncbi:DUF2515 family protein [Bacillus norwichensis]|uniref:DUF2515 family protein n=1 Tax=Bacillus norwichensis TaxID=2762217 RepID=A0ABR8VJA3_9BACI|nr:DUF2515 family protein [Bacillus norwichensis]MBD8004853.1 DUF2515 family protein [Bacillus norwichensis]